MKLSLALYGAVEAVLGRSITWRLGRWLYLGSRRELLNDPAVNGEYALQKAWCAARRSQPVPDRGYCIIDVGANLGDWTVSFERELQRARLDRYSILAFEPAPSQRAAMIARCGASIAAGRVSVEPQALGAEAGSATLMVTGDRTGNSALTSQRQHEVDGAPIDIEVTTLDAVCSQRNLTHVDFVKVDTEGNDFNVILGARRLFDKEAVDILQFEYNWRWIDFRHWLSEVFAFLRNRPYVLGRLTPKGVEFYDDWHYELDKFTETNYIIAHLNILPVIPHWHAVFDLSNVPTKAPSPLKRFGLWPTGEWTISHPVIEPGTAI